MGRPSGWVARRRADVGPHGGGARRDDRPRCSSTSTRVTIEPAGQVRACGSRRRGRGRPPSRRPRPWRARPAAPRPSSRPVRVPAFMATSPAQRAGDAGRELAADQAELLRPRDQAAGGRARAEEQEPRPALARSSPKASGSFTTTPRTPRSATRRLAPPPSAKQRDAPGRGSRRRSATRSSGSRGAHEQVGRPAHADRGARGERGVAPALAAQAPRRSRRGWSSRGAALARHRSSIASSSGPQAVTSPGAERDDEVALVARARGRRRRAGRGRGRNVTSRWPQRAHRLGQARRPEMPGIGSSPAA